MSEKPKKGNAYRGLSFLAIIIIAITAFINGCLKECDEEVKRPSLVTLSGHLEGEGVYVLSKDPFTISFVLNDGLVQQPCVSGYIRNSHRETMAAVVALLKSKEGNLDKESISVTGLYDRRGFFYMQKISIGESNFELMTVGNLHYNVEIDSEKTERSY